MITKLRCGGKKGGKLNKGRKWKWFRREGIKKEVAISRSCRLSKLQKEGCILCFIWLIVLTSHLFGKQATRYKGLNYGFFVSMVTCSIFYCFFINLHISHIFVWWS